MSVETNVLRDSVRVVASLAESAGGSDSTTSRPTPPAYYRLGDGNIYPYKNEPRCKVCNCDHRRTIDTALLKGINYPTIAMMLPEVVRVRDREATITPANIRSHFLNKHVPADVYVRRQALEARLTADGLDPETFDGQMVNHMVLLQEMVNQAWQGLVSGEIRVDASTALGAINAFIKVDALKQESVDQEFMNRVFAAAMDCWNRVIEGVDSGRIAPTQEAMRYAFGTLMNATPEIVTYNARQAIGPAEASATSSDEG